MKVSEKIYVDGVDIDKMLSRFAMEKLKTVPYHIIIILIRFKHLKMVIKLDPPTIGNCVQT